jgi:putative restriction endonuclease
VRVYVGVTDMEWYRFLAGLPAVDEVNFWRPAGDRAFRALTAGELFLFKTHHPHNRIVGGGVFERFDAMTVTAAWEVFGELNGTANLSRMLDRIGHYRDAPIASGEDPRIGCIFLRDVQFFLPADTAAPPPDFASNIVQGKGYDLERSPSAGYLGEVLHRLFGFNVDGPSWYRTGPVYGDPRLAPQRLGQRAFRVAVSDAYHHNCAITGGKIRPVLEAAHVQPLAAGGEHRLDNGLLLRSDVHTLYDRGYLAVDPKHRLLVSPLLRTEFGNGEQFYAMAGQEITVPERRADRPRSEYLEWHLAEVFRRA